MIISINKYKFKKQNKKSHIKFINYVNYILILIILFLILLLNYPFRFTGFLTLKGGYINSLNISIKHSTTKWSGVYGNITSINQSNVLILTSSDLVIGKNISSNEQSTNKTILASTSNSLNLDSITNISYQEFDTYFDLKASERSSNIFKTKHTFYINGKNINLSSVKMNTLSGDLWCGIAKDNKTQIPVIVSEISHVIGFNNHSLNFEIILPVKNNPSIFYFYLDELPNLCNINVSLFIGQNWISIPCNNSNMSIDYVLSSIGHGKGSLNEQYPGFGSCTGNASDNFYGNYTVVWTYNASDNKWLSYVPDKFCFMTQSLNRIDVKHNYQIMMNNTDVLIFKGHYVNIINISLFLGSNWIGYPKKQVLEIDRALSSIGHGKGSLNEQYPGFGSCTGNASDNFYGNYTVVWTYNASDNKWLSYVPDKFCFMTQSLNRLKPGEGYQIMVNNTDILIFKN